jgi:hypothetical protein
MTSVPLPSVIECSLLLKVVKAGRLKRLLFIGVNKYTVEITLAVGLVGGGFHGPDLPLVWCNHSWRPLANRCIHTLYMSGVCVLFGWGMEWAYKRFFGDIHTNIN